MDLFSNLALGFGVALSLKNLALCFTGCFIGTLIGVLPGVGPIATIAMLLPITFGIDPVGALIMLAGIYYGAQYGGSTTAILVNIPGEATSVVTTLDGHQMAKQGRAGVALGISAIGSFIAGSVATILIAALGAPLTRMALLFGPAEYFSLMVMGLCFAVVLARGSILKAIAMILLGLLFSTIGTDLETGQERMTFGFAPLSDGLDFAVLAMGIFGFAEVIKNLENPETRDVVRQKVGRLLPNLAEMKQSALPIVRGTFLGSALGILPGNGAVLGPFASYTLEKKLAKDSSRFGRGAIEGVAGPAVRMPIPKVVAGVGVAAGVGEVFSRHGETRCSRGAVGRDWPWPGRGVRPGPRSPPPRRGGSSVRRRGSRVSRWLRRRRASGRRPVAIRA